MDLNIEKFVQEQRIKELSKKLLESKTDTFALTYLKEITSIKELRKIRAFLQCQKREIGNNFAAVAIFISAFALIFSGIDKLFIKIPYFYPISIIIFGVIITWIVIKDGVSFINNTNEHNSKIEYLLWLIDEEVNERNARF
ncbi:hypothetical protein ACTWQL_22850 [Pseudalkalibacillus sp. R45]|uniref:hypothetical protein n=1 Tax=Pseudalkalibacillus sp. R45 TaxID=3457433 RepID=UPI003FCD76E2